MIYFCCFTEHVQKQSNQTCSGQLRRKPTTTLIYKINVAIRPIILDNSNLKPTQTLLYWSFDAQQGLTILLETLWAGGQDRLRGLQSAGQRCFNRAHIRAGIKGLAGKEDGGAIGFL
jgi:hypothetical protein